MPVPVSYTEQELKDYMLGEVGNLADILELTTGHFDEAVNDVLLALDEESVEAVGEDDIPRLRAAAAVEAWRVAVKRSAGWYNFRSGSDMFERKAVHDQARKGLADAEVRAAAFSVSHGYGLVTGRITFPDSPYLRADE